MYTFTCINFHVNIYACPQYMYVLCMRMGNSKKIAKIRNQSWKIDVWIHLKSKDKSFQNIRDQPIRSMPELIYYFISHQIKLQNILWTNNNGIHLSLTWWVKLYANSLLRLKSWFFHRYESKRLLLTPSLNNEE